ncbi:MAG TPA: 30S ribosomal protein S17 [Candidatus Nitrosocosmicus sp.]|nr:30S ribosomal protein S17 [Candidatus Nitrosocosmicus sp.]
MAKVLQGKVVSNKMDKTIVVEVERVYRHPLYKKTLRKHKKYKVHNEDDNIEVNDVVSIEETRPMSKEKRFKVLKLISSKGGK